MFHNTSIYEQLTALPYLPAYKRLLEGAIELDVFSQLEQPVSAADLARRMGWNEANTRYLLQGLHSIGFAAKKDDLFRNTSETSEYLVKGKPGYMGGVLLFFGANQGMALEGLAEQVKNGPQPTQQAEQSLDFAAYGAMMREAQSGIRQQELVSLVRSLPENGEIRRILDLGCGAGLLGIAVVNDAAARSGVLFDQPPMQALMEETVSMQAMQDRITVVAGDFLRDDIGAGYDLILCSSIMLFAIGKLILATGDVTWLIFLLVYGIDGCCTIIHRIMLHENLGEAHRKHAFQLMANELKMGHVTVSLIYMGLQLAISLGFIYLIPNTIVAHWVYSIAVGIVLAGAYVVFMKKYYHLHEEYLASLEVKR